MDLSEARSTHRPECAGEEGEATQPGSASDDEKCRELKQAGSDMSQTLMVGQLASLRVESEVAKPTASSSADVSSAELQ